MGKAIRSNLVFALNGERVELNDVDPQTTLLSYIRNETDYKGTKRGCGEGGCGSCVVLLSKYDPESKEVEEYTINSCLAPVCSVDGCAVTTTEGFKRGKEPHPVHTRLAGFHASQCGFCTPGMAVTIASSLRKCSRQNKEDGSTKQLVCADAEKFIAGNLCRCTGYRPILDACKSFAADVDIEDLGINTFWESSEDEDLKKSTLKLSHQPEEHPKFPSYLENPSGEILEVTSIRPGEERAWRSASTLTELFDIHSKERDEKKRDVHFVVGNTSSGVYKDFKPSVYIDISKIPELQRIAQTDSALEVGAAVSLSKLISYLSKSGGPVFSELADHLRKVANQHVRNRGSVGGNLIMSKKHGFASDVATILLGVGSRVTITSAKDKTLKEILKPSLQTHTIDLEDFLAGPPLETSILQSIHIPLWERLSEEKSERVLCRTYRSSPRVNGNAVSSINAAFLALVQASEPDGSKPASRVSQVRLAFGALGGPHAIRAKETEKYLNEKIITVDVLREAVRTLREELTSSARDDQLHTAEYRVSVGVGYLFKFFKPLITETDLDSPPSYENGVDGVLGDDHVGNGGHEDACGNGVTNGSAAKETGARSFGRNARKTDRREGFSGKQSFPIWNEHYPVSQPTGKFAAVLQGTGEAVYVDDIPLPAGSLHAALVCSKKALAKITAVDASDALASPGAKSFISVKDIPPNGENVGNIFAMTQTRDRIFAEDSVGFVGHPIGVMVADSYEHALEAARKVKVEYDETVLGRPILTVEEAAAKNLFKTTFLDILGKASIGENLEKGDFRIENVELFAGGQYYFYMETQTTLAIPDEDDCITVYSSTQSPEPLQLALAAALGVPLHNVRVITRRLGGAFGGKNTKSQMIAVACALAAFVLKKPVRMTLDRNTDMEYCGGRHESKARYTVEFNKDGKIKSLDTFVLMNGGYDDDYKDLMGLLMTKAMRCYNWTTWRHETKVCRTNLPGRSMMRAPGEIQGNFFSESIIEDVASFLGMDPAQVREVNLHTYESAAKFYGPAASSKGYFTLPKIWQRLKDSSHYGARKISVREFNQKHMWLKRGISINPILYPCLQQPRLARVTIFADGSVAVESGGTEMGQGLFTKVQQATAYGLSQLWNEKGAGKVPLSKIRIVQNDSISLGNAGNTNAGTTSEGTCEAAVSACNVLVNTLRPVLEELQSEGTETPSWEAVVAKAKGKNLPLSAQGRHSYVNYHETEYLVCGAAVSEVEVDVLTGGVTILQTDILYDTGKSLNPAVDIGQIEGAFVQGVGYFVTEEVKWDENGVLITNGTWTYKPPTTDNIPHQFNVELLNTAVDPSRILSSKSAGEPPLLLATSVHNSIREAIRSARADLQLLAENEPVSRKEKGGPHFLMHSSVTMQNVKKLCGLDTVEQYLDWLSKSKLR
ncbi:hypothetical protein R1sor_026961 [Riccia sorocarpa]|uniref:Aldehyde oxidase n=1 Tax=Riccia sorocarpa TaxID=122646 RepID=A0ABD3GCX2_9MARC